MNEQVNEHALSTADLAGTRQYQSNDMSNMPSQSDGGNGTRPNQAVQQQSGNGEMARPMPLLASQESESMRSRWSAIQIGFVDDPRHAVEMADSLVAEMMQRLAQVFASQRGQLEGQWGKGQDVSTEELRLALRQYRSFFDRLLSV